MWRTARAAENWRCEKVTKVQWWMINNLGKSSQAISQQQLRIIHQSASWRQGNMKAAQHEERKMMINVKRVKFCDEAGDLRARETRRRLLRDLAETLSPSKHRSLSTSSSLKVPLSRCPFIPSPLSLPPLMLPDHISLSLTLPRGSPLNSWFPFFPLRRSLNIQIKMT